MCVVECVSSVVNSGDKLMAADCQILTINNFRALLGGNGQAGTFVSPSLACVFHLELACLVFPHTLSHALADSLARWLLTSSDVAVK